MDVLQRRALWTVRLVPIANSGFVREVEPFSLATGG